MRTYKRNQRGIMSVQTYMKAAKEVLAKACSLKIGYAKCSVNYTTLQILFKIHENKSGSKFYTKVL
jgi:hypothetical protein